MPWTTAIASNDNPSQHPLPHTIYTHSHAHAHTDTQIMGESWNRSILDTPYTRHTLQTPSSSCSFKLVMLAGVEWELNSAIHNFFFHEDNTVVTCLGTRPLHAVTWLSTDHYTSVTPDSPKTITLWSPDSHQTCTWLSPDLHGLSPDHKAYFSWQKAN